LFGQRDDALNSIVTIICGAIVLFFPVFVFFKIYYNFQILETEEFKDKYATLIEDLDLHSKWAPLYLCFFLLRRFITIVTIVLAPGAIYLQLVTLMVLSILNCIYLLHLKPYLDKSFNKLEFYNELTILLNIYLMLFFIDPSLQTNTTHRNFFGWLMILNAALNILGNLALILNQSVRKTLADCRHKFAEKRAKTQRENKLIEIA